MRAPAMARMRAALTPDQTIAAWEVLIAAPDDRTAFVRALLPGVSIDKGANAESIEGAIPPYDMPALKVAHRHADTGLEPGVWRSGAHSATAFFTECFIDELAAASGLDPLSFRIRMLRSKPRHAEALKTAAGIRSEEHTSELQSLMRISYAVFCLKKKKNTHKNHQYDTTQQ